MTTELELRQRVVDQITSWKGAVKGDATHRHIIDTYNTITPLPRKTRMSYTMEWCAATVSAVFQTVGLIDLIPPECSCGLMVAGAQAMGIWVEDDAYRPKIGDIILYDWQDDGKGDNTGAPDHVGIVTKVDGNKFTVTEGNRTVNGKSVVADREMLVNGRYIRGFICPRYAEKAAELNKAASSLDTDTKRQEDDDMTKEEVQKLIEEAKPKVYTTVEECPGWAQPLVDRLMEAKILTGDQAGKLYLTTDILVVLQSLANAGVL